MYIHDNISTAEVFPDNYETFRNDRNWRGGGTFVSVSKDYIASEITDFDSDCEATWVRINVAGHRSLVVCSFYRPQWTDAEYMDSLNNIVSSICNQSNSILMLGGDFNLPNIVWTDYTVTPGASYNQLSRKMLDMVSDNGLSQLVDFPTRESNILDLFLTNVPGLVNKIQPAPGISDHDIVFIDSSLKPKMVRQPRRKIFLYKKGD